MNPEAIATAATQRGTFSFIDAIRGRNYGTREVPIVLDDDPVLRVLDIRESLDGNEDKKIKPELDPDRISALEEELRQAEADLSNYRYVVKLRGISPQRREELIMQARETYPPETRERTIPLTGEKIEEELPNVDRDKYFTHLLWHESIVSVTDPAGDVANDLSLEAAALFYREAPIAARYHIGLALEELRLSTDWYEGITNEDFTQKP